MGMYLRTVSLECDDCGAVSGPLDFLSVRLSPAFVRVHFSNRKKPFAKGWAYKADDDRAVCAECMRRLADRVEREGLVT